MLGFNNPAVGHPFRDRFHPRVAICPLHVFNPKRTQILVLEKPYDSLALFEIPSHALRPVENTLVTSLITQSSQVQILPSQPFSRQANPK